MAHNSRDQEKFLDLLAATPNISIACKKTGIARATIYRWMKSSYRFRQKALAAMNIGRENMVDMAEAGLITKARNGDMAAIKFILQHNSKRYSDRAAPFEPEIEKVDQFAAFRGPDGKLLVSKGTAELIEKQHKEELERKSRAMGFPPV